LAIEMIIEYNF